MRNKDGWGNDTSVGTNPNQGAGGQDKSAAGDRDAVSNQEDGPRDDDKPSGYQGPREEYRRCTGRDGAGNKGDTVRDGVPPRSESLEGIVRPVGGNKCKTRPSTVFDFGKSLEKEWKKGLIILEGARKEGVVISRSDFLVHCCHDYCMEQ